MEAINSSQRNSQAPVPAAQTNATAPSLLSRFATTIEREPMPTPSYSATNDFAPNQFTFYRPDPDAPNRRQ